MAQNGEQAQKMIDAAYGAKWTAGTKNDRRFIWRKMESRHKK
jgi:hypothetical protein